MYTCISIYIYLSIYLSLLQEDVARMVSVLGSALLFASICPYTHIPLPPQQVSWPIQDIVLFLGLRARINTILCAPTLCLGTPNPPVIAHTTAQYNVSPRQPVIVIYTTQYWQCQSRVKANRYLFNSLAAFYLR